MSPLMWPWSPLNVALRKESVDRNQSGPGLWAMRTLSLSARRAWIEINVGFPIAAFLLVALRKESVDRNPGFAKYAYGRIKSLSARRAWIEMEISDNLTKVLFSRSPQGERG